MSNIKPEDYLNISFDTIKSDIIDSLKKTDTFKDYNFEGSNISVLIELISYLGELNTYYMNKISKNLYIDTTDLYENMHRLAQLTGYNPHGYKSSSTDLTIMLSQNENGNYFELGDMIYVPRFKKFYAEEDTETINFVSVEDTYIYIDLEFTENGSSDELLYFEFDIPIKEGNIVTYNFTRQDIFNNRIFLPFLQFDHHSKGNVENSVWLSVNDNMWNRVNNFYEDLSGLENEFNVFRVIFDKFKRYLIEFSPNLKVPDSATDEIEVNMIQTIGENGNVGSNMISEIGSEEVVYNSTKDIWISNSNISIQNRRASSGGSSPETVLDLKQNSKNFFHTQYRCITKKDYKNYLENMDDVLKATAFGQNELRYSSDTRDYNKVYLSLIPKDWNSPVIITEEDTWTADNEKSSTILNLVDYYSSFKESVEEYLDPYKSLNTYHVFQLPELVHFAFDFTIKIKRNYEFTEVVNDIKDKMKYLYSYENLNFEYELDYMNMEEEIQDIDIESESNSFPNIRGIKYLRIRDIHCDSSIYEPNRESDYPQYTTQDLDSYVENKLRSIKLGYSQFPVFVIDSCLFEG